tara:strand:+ start:774 stop:1838 length:1065 start_codon:yes stop_codon:yes gene_type:complete
MAYSTITKPGLHFNTVTFTGNNSTQNITGVGFQPDLVWTKKRNGTTNHLLYDAVRGVGYYLYPNLTNAQGGNGTSALTAFNADGFTLDAGDDANGSGATGVGWSWKAGTTSGITQGGASITPTSYSLNATAGFSIIKYTGTGSNATVPHGLGATPEMVIVRNYSDAEQWVTYHNGLDTSGDGTPEDYHIRLNSDAAKVDEAAVWNDTAFTTNTFSIGTSGASNGSGDNHIAYCFKSIPGYSLVGSFIGNGNVDGTFVNCGFKPAFLLTRRISTTASWRITDSKRDIDNPANTQLYPNQNAADYTEYDIDFLSNGFKMRNNGAQMNASTYATIFYAVAEEPLVANVGKGIPATAR